MAKRERSLLIVNFRSAELAREAVASARQASSAPLQVVIVDNSCDDAELARLRDLDVLLIAAERNLGYAGGINRGVESCGGEVIVIANPDVVFGEGSIDRLAAALSEGIGMSGPALFWDIGHEWHLPPADPGSMGEKLSELAALRSSSWRARRERARARRRVRFWSDSSTRRVDAISGAVMCVDRAVLDSIGTFDEQYPLYFEEIDFMRRMHGISGIAYVPSAQCRHLYNQSASMDGAASLKYLQSEYLYYRKWYGARFVSLVGRFGRDPHPPLFAPDLEGSAIPIEEPLDEVVVELSPSASFDSAAGHFPQSQEVAVPREIWSDHRGETLHARLIDRRSGRERRRFRLRKPGV
ncbi:MAG TPA: glycosyltransferase family 2 protein [Thermoanaerobaculia bacterium]|nr:glycosyltransferase family 2 protein [Thermoanaerobaculia bacterium]